MNSKDKYKSINCFVMFCILLGLLGLFNWYLPTFFLYTAFNACVFSILTAISLQLIHKEQTLFCRALNLMLLFFSSALLYGYLNKFNLSLPLIDELPFIGFIAGAIIAILSIILIKIMFSFKKGHRQLLQTRKALTQAHDRLQGIIEGSTDLIAAINLKHEFIAFNSMYKNEIFRLFNISLRIGMNFNVLQRRMSKENQKKIEGCWTRALNGESFTVITSFEDKHFDGLDYEIHYNPIRNAHGHLMGASLIAINIHQRIQNELKLADSKRKLEKTVKDLAQQNKDLELLKELTSLLQSSRSLNDAIEMTSNYIQRIMRDTSGVIYLKIKEHSRQMKQILIWGKPHAPELTIKQEDCLALTRHQSYHSAMDGIICKHVKVHTEKPENYICLPLLAQDETFGLLYIELKSNHQRLMALSEIISEQIALSFYNIKLRENLKIQSMQDSLTELYNRRFFEEYVQKEILKAKRHPTTFAILLLDIDCFKKINDTYGHLMGDKALKEVAQKLQENCRQSDLVSRWGGEEFIIYLREISLENAVLRAEIIRESIEELNIIFHHVQLHTPITVSIGIALFPIHGGNIDQLTSSADKALYLAKDEGRNKVMISNK